MRLFLKTLCLLLVAGLAHGQKVDRNANLFSRQLKPANFSKGSEKDLGRARGEIIKLIEQLERNNRTAKQSPDSLLSKAFEFKEDQIGPNQAMVTSTALLRNWKSASSMGLFSENGKFQDQVVSGRGTGKKVVFEYIVPPSVAPEYAKYIGNVRLVSPERARAKDAEPDQRDLAYLRSLQNVKREAEGRAKLKEMETSKAAMPKKDLNHLGMTKKEEEARYLNEVEAAGAAALDRAPSIRVQGRLGARPSHMSKERYRVDFEIRNLSNHPTEIEITYWVLGFTDKENKIYIMEQKTEKAKLRAGQVNNLEIWTRPVNSFRKKAKALDNKKSDKVIYKGYIAIAKFKGKEVVGIAASDARLMAYATGERPGLATFPKF
ncbi:MAG: hypothetical protein HKN23_19245 [Verrucomicrobiales bacterium]|nr:hypothetical protein [Verrucomicrobiales bacterium]